MRGAHIMAGGRITKHGYCVVLLLITALILSSVQTAVAEEYFNKSFEWYYKGNRWTWNLSIPKSLYDSYKRVSVSDRIRYGFAGYGFLVTTQDSYVRLVANKLHEAAVDEGYEAYDEVSFVLAFVQSLPYTSDLVTTGYDEYPRFPIETLVDGGGDCEDTSILFATITLILNYDTVFISLPQHLAVGVWGTNVPGYYYTYHDRTYYYCETTGENWEIGDIPNEYQGTLANIYSINQNTQYDPTQDLTNPFSSLLVPLMVFAVVLLGTVIGLLYAFKRLRKKPRIEEYVEPKMEEKIFCRYCGAENWQDAVYCIKCGKKIGEV